MTDFFFSSLLRWSWARPDLLPFLWSLKSGQYEDLEGAAERILSNEDDKPIVNGRKPNSLPETGDKSAKN